MLPDSPDADRPWARPADEVASALGTDPTTGLTGTEPAQRLERFGPNRLDAKPPEPPWRRVARQFADPLVLLLLGAIVISLVAWLADGSPGAPVEAIVIAIIVVANAVIGAWQETRAERAVAALQEMAATRTTVIRDGRTRTVPSLDLVPGDIVELAAGDAVGADCRVLATASLEIAEASLTGESMPVTKRPDPVAAETPVADRSSMAFGGTAVTNGRGRAVVVATGMNTEIGRIAALLDDTGDDDTPLQREIAWLGRMLGWIVVVLSIVVVGVILVSSDVSGVSDVVDALLVGVSLAVAAVPEGLPAILTIVLALGVQRMAERRAIVKRLASVETLGAASVICTDKTGTLTRNEMAIVTVLTATGRVEITGSGYAPVGEARRDGAPLDDERLRRDVARVVAAGSIANDARFEVDDPEHWEAAGDPTEIAFLVAREKLHLGRDGDGERVAEIPFDSERKLMTTVHLDRGPHFSREEARPVQITKGAPEILLGRCSSIRAGDVVDDLSPTRRDEIVDEVGAMADRGLRTLAVAYRSLGELPSELAFADEDDLTLLGVVGIVDPPRPEAADAVADARRGGVRTIMITGDHPRTAGRIATELGIGDGTPTVMAGTEFAAVADDDLADVVRATDVFARVEPADKLRIVRALQADGRITAMTGDGVNDAPALRQADIGVSMGIAGTEVAKEASDMILADDDFATILRAVREGREIFANIRKFLRYLLASNAGEVLVVVLGVLLAGAIGLRAGSADGELAVPLLATQILWINLLTDSALALALGVDPSVDDVMSRPPRRLDERVVDGRMWVTIALVGVTTALAGLIAFDLELSGGLLGGDGDVETARTMVFTTLVLAQVANAFNARSDQVSAFVQPFANRLLWISAAVTVAAQVAVVHVRPLGTAFDTEPLGVVQWSICLGLASTVLWVDEIRKLVVRRAARSG